MNQFDDNLQLPRTPEHIFKSGALKIRRGPIRAWSLKFMLVLLRSR